MGLPTPPSEIASPCIRTCCLDDDDVCIGCGRALAEIVAWGTADDAQRRAILERSRVRVALRAERYTRRS
jgi:predicted Fe-S protein YdhL (DUF1289 family)